MFYDRKQLEIYHHLTSVALENYIRGLKQLERSAFYSNNYLRKEQYYYYQQAYLRFRERARQFEESDESTEWLVSKALRSNLIKSIVLETTSVYDLVNEILTERLAEIANPFNDLYHEVSATHPHIPMRSPNCSAQNLIMISEGISEITETVNESVTCDFYNGKVVKSYSSDFSILEDRTRLLMDETAHLCAGMRTLQTMTNERHSQQQIEMSIIAARYAIWINVFVVVGSTIISILLT